MYLGKIDLLNLVEHVSLALTCGTLLMLIVCLLWLFGESKYGKALKKYVALRFPVIAVIYLISSLAWLGLTHKRVQDDTVAINMSYSEAMPYLTSEIKT